MEIIYNKPLYTPESWTIELTYRYEMEEHFVQNAFLAPDKSVILSNRIQVKQLQIFPSIKSIVPI